MKNIKAEDILKGGTPVQTVPTTQVMNFDLVTASSEETINAILTSGPCKVSFLNAHCANIAHRSEDYAHSLHRADFVLPDGIGINLAARMAGKEIRENLNGTDFIPKFLKQAARLGNSVYLFGGKPGTAQAAAHALCQEIDGLDIVGTRDGFAGMVGAAEDIAHSGADIVIVALGVPLQELWIERHFHELKADVAIGVGACLDFIAGNVKRAPRIVRQMHMEWGWRLLMEPRRMAGRYLIGNITFMANAALTALRETPKQNVIRRLMDATLSLMALIALSPLLITVAAAISIESRGAPLFKQTRVGKSGRPFTLYKFRSMYKDAEARRAALVASSDRDGVCFKSKEDPRITKIGRLLRRLSIDELPQILNILKGDMSIVGPRPGLPSEVENYDERALNRLDVKPGLTGLWQVAGRADIGFEQMITMDLAYVRARSIALDAMIIGLTIRAVWSGRGAY